MLAMDEGTTASFISFCIFGGPVLLWFAMRYMKHRERMAMIARGIVPPGVAPQSVGYQGPPPGFDPRVAQQRPYVQQTYGKKAGSRNDDESTPDELLRKGIRLAFIGLAVTIGLSFIGVHHDGSFTPGPWLLGGLIPLFIGLSMIVNGVLSGADVAAFRRGPGPMPPYGNIPPPPNPSVPGPGSARGYAGPVDASYTYRPGVTPEIDAPPRPPERR